MQPRVETANGAIEGLARPAHLRFLGIPYARPPVGKLRFSAPQPAEPWSGVREAKQFGKSAMQGIQFVPGDETLNGTGEDCLFLNVFTRALGARKRPVMVWIHGGAYTVGSASLPIYDGGRLCEVGDVVVVSLNYRLGAFGFLQLGQAGERMDALPNLGLLDQVAALRWVQENISQFGGDPNNVTIFGESAGATSVCSLLCMEAAQGLFCKAIAQSTALTLRLADFGNAERTTDLLLKKLGLDLANAERLRELPAEQITQAQRAIEEEELTWLGFFPVVHPATLPVDPDVALKNGGQRSVPLLIGHNRDEWNLFDAVNIMRWNAPMAHEELSLLLQKKLPIDAAQAEQLITGYRNSRREQQLPSHENALLRAILGDHRFGITGLRFAEDYQQTGAAVFAYRFHQTSPALRGMLGACHALEIPFVFGTYGVPGQERFAGSGPLVEALSDTMMRCWLSFAEHGAPRHVADWQQYEPSQRTTIIFDAETRVVRDPCALERQAWSGIRG